MATSLYDQSKLHEDARLSEIGETSIAEGRVAVILAAGGMGTRLGLAKPKGCLEVGPRNESGFEIIVRKIAANGNPMFGIMVSDVTLHQTVQCLDDLDWSGRGNLFWLRQEMLPVYDMQQKKVIRTAPDGHGGVFPAMLKSGFLENMVERGVEVVSYVQMDNPLAEFLDPTYIGLFYETKAKMVCKVVDREAVDEPCSIVTVSDDESVSVMDWRYARDEGWPAGLGLGFTSIMLFDVEFVQTIALDLDRYAPLRQYVQGVEFRLERVVFDPIKQIPHEVALVKVDRELEFAPIKNSKDSYTLGATRVALLSKLERLGRI